MDVRFGRWWRRGRATPDAAADARGAATPAAPTVTDVPEAAYYVVPPAPSSAAPGAGPVEQPVLVPAASADVPARIGVVLPAPRPSALLQRLPVPRVPKRTVFTIGLCAGLAAPVVGRQLAIRALMGLLGQGKHAGPVEGATVEIIRVHYAGAAAGHAASAVTKILEQARR
jgi:hypothetical protein